MGSKIRTLFVVLMVVVIGCGGDGEDAGDPCGDIQAKVTGGASCSADGSPVVAVVAYKIADNRQVPVSFCTGTVVTNDDVLTAAHCIQTPLSRGAEGFMVVTSNGRYSVTRYKVNSLFQGIGSSFDTAMLTVSNSLGISPLPINISDEVRKGEEVTLYGYGRDGEGQSFETLGLSALRAGKMVVSDTARGVLVAGFNDSGSAVCQGDSGGPVIQILAGTPSIVGVNSFTRGGCEEDSTSGLVSMQIKGNVDFVRGYAGDVLFI